MGNVPGHRDDEPARTPAWVPVLADLTSTWSDVEPGLSRLITLRPAAVLVLLMDTPLTRRASSLTNYPDRLVFPGGAIDDRDDGPVTAALREAHEEVGLDPSSVHIIGLLPPLALVSSGHLVTPVLAWSPRPEFSGDVNVAEVAEVLQPPLSAAVDSTDEPQSISGSGDYGRLTCTLLDLLAHAMPASPSVTDTGI